MNVALLQVVVQIPDARSLKDKRRIVQGLLDRLRNEYPIAAAEIEDQDVWQSAVLGFAAWLSGEGALAWCAVERCLEGDPGDALAHNVAALLQNAIPPSTWTPMPPSQIPALSGWSERAS